MTTPATSVLTGHVHFMGIAGAGMSALAEALVHGGIEVSGCDLSGSTPHALAALGVPVSQGHSPEHLEGVTALIITAAVPDNHPEVTAARQRGIPVVKRAAALGAWVAGGRVVAVAGTHGKTSTTAMVTHVLDAAALSPTGFVGGTVRAWGSNLRLGGGELFAVEADEYDRSFLHLSPDVAVVTNIEADHLDIYGDLAGVMEAFRTFVGQVRPGGTVVGCADDGGVGRLLPSATGPVVTYGLSAGAMVRAVDVVSVDGRVQFSIVEDGKRHDRFRLAVPGLHNVRNALGAAAAARAIGVSWDDIRKGLADFAGVGRRFERVGEVASRVVVDDYAHHPTEVDATLEAARQAYPDRRIVAVFQPHLYSRTRDFHGEFGRALAKADLVWVADIYPAREAPIEGVDGALVAQAAERYGAKVRYHASLEDLAAHVAPDLEANDLCLTMGAGSIEHIGPQIVDELRTLHTVSPSASGS